MKSREIIKKLLELDPSGETECCVGGNADILVIERVSAYWDGLLQVLERDETGQFARGAHRVKDGDKIVLRDLSIADAIDDDPDFTVTYGVEGMYYKEQDEAVRTKAREEWASASHEEP